MSSESKSQQKMAGAALACKRGEGPCKGGASKMAKNMSEKQLREYASTKHKGLPQKVKKGKGK